MVPCPPGRCHSTREHTVVLPDALGVWGEAAPTQVLGRALQGGLPEDRVLSVSHRDEWDALGPQGRCPAMLCMVGLGDVPHPWCAHRPGGSISWGPCSTCQGPGTKQRASPVCEMNE